MSIGSQGEHLFFLVSQPRSGSTLLQRILAKHPAVHTTSEPWLMLHPLYALRQEGHTAEYDTYWSREALLSFLGTLPSEAAAYYEGVRRMYRYLYDEATTHAGARCFLDKSPRYYFILPELHRTFPEAQTILLLRNPLSVMASVLKTWVKKRWFRLWEYRHDLLTAPHRLADASTSRDDLVSVRYEALATQPEATIRALCTQLGLAFEPAMIDYGQSDEPDWRFGDPTGVQQHTRPVASRLDAWQAAAADDAQVWRLLHEYLERLGPATLKAMGYEYDDLASALDDLRPGNRALRYTFSMDWLMRVRETERAAWERKVVRLAHSVRHRGVGGALSASLRSKIGM